MEITAIVPAAGRGSRLRNKADKVFATLDKKPILFHTLKNLEETKEIRDIILVVSKRSLNYTRDIFLKRFPFPKIEKVVVGGKTRAESVWNGLSAVRADTKFVFIHDGARPFVDADSLERVIKGAEKFGAAILGIPIPSTVKKVKKFCVVETVERKFLWQIQTPQIFRKSLLINCYRKAMRAGFKPTDDAQVLEHYGHKVRVIEGSPLNIKITTPEDLVLAKAILQIKRSFI